MRFVGLQKWRRRLFRLQEWRRRAVGLYWIRVLIRPSVHGHHGSIAIATVARAHGDAFVVSVRDALTLIEETDTAAWNTVVREIDYVVNDLLISGGAYRRSERSCAIDFGRWYTGAASGTPEYTYFVASLACTIVHEATHGRIWARGIPYNTKTWQRIERLCENRARRFAARQLSAVHDYSTLVPPFDPDRWKPYRNRWSRRQLWWAVLPRLAADLRHRQDSPPLGSGSWDCRRPKS